MKEKSWNKVKNKKSFGKKDLRKYGFIYCSTIEYFWRVAPNFRDVKESLVLICIDKDKLTSEIKYEDSDNAEDIILISMAKLILIQLFKCCHF